MINNELISGGPSINKKCNVGYFKRMNSRKFLPFFVVIFCHTLNGFHVLAAEDIELNEELLKWKPPGEFRNKHPYSQLGNDFDGAPVIYVNFGKWDFVGTLSQSEFHREALAKYLYQAMVRMMDSGSDPAKSGAIVIINMDGFTAKQALNPFTVSLAWRTFQKLGSVFAAGGFKQVIIVNNNYLFQRIWEFGSPALGGVAQNFQLYGSKASTWKPQLLKIIPRDQLPDFLGGVKEHKPVAVYP